ncbi:MAG: DEAD/DEAH box helicase [Labilithrix sp.]|nr:DEAD/DEAH box helicase [Labilithrix sp.]
MKRVRERRGEGRGTPRRLAVVRSAKRPAPRSPERRGSTGRAGRTRTRQRVPAGPRETQRQVTQLQSAPASAGATISHDTFASLGLAHELVRAVAQEGYVRPTPIQERAIAPVLDGRDLLGCAQTGTGKTAAFVLPVLQRLARSPQSGKVRALVVAPTRELAAQIDERITAYGRHVGLRHAVIYGGVGQRAQEEAVRRRPDILVATPGRLLDLMQQGIIRLDGVEILVLDEADRMLDMGFIHDVRRIVAAVPKQRQTLLFSATIPTEIARLISSVLTNPVRVDIAPEVTTAERVDQCVYFVAKTEKRHLLERLIREEGAGRSIVFTRTKHGANRLAEQLSRGGIRAEAIHGNKSQGARERALEGFRTGTLPVLVATDLAARGIDVDGVSHVFNFDLPNVPESYVHRIGRTGRAGASGRAIAFCDAEERPLLRDIERFVKKPIPVAGTVAARPVDPAELARADGGERADHSGHRQGGGRASGPGQRQGGGRANGSGQQHGRANGSGQRQGGGRANGSGQQHGRANGSGQHPGGGRANGHLDRAQATGPSARAATTDGVAPGPGAQPATPAVMPGDSTRRHRSRRFRGARI